MGQGLFERIRFRGQPRANAESVVVSGNARFTLLTPRLIRLEWSETGEFEDRATLAFPGRRSPAPAFVLETQAGTLVITTGALTVRYVEGSGPFAPENLSIGHTAGDPAFAWVPGMVDDLNLRGTRRTLDGCEAAAALEDGIISRAGWALVDDSRSVLLDPEDGWLRPRPDHQVQDWYFFGYGHDYEAALADYTSFAGPIPLIPRYVLGAWWSRYWAYSEADLRGLVAAFEQHGLPLDVLVLDMDWHTPHAWTGYTWNRALFPDPPAFLQWLHDKGLRVTLNLHPAEGVQPHEEIYARCATALGIDPACGEAIPFRIADRAFVQQYFELLHHPMEDQGVDFWWLDWQQGEAAEMKGLDPLPWLNHLHFHDAARRGLRPLIYSRWGGLGNHRYQIGFSGDTYVGWPALGFQPYFTATAANVLFGWWSHDIGGHMGGGTEAELYARWVQFGVLSPCLRLHATKDPLAERRPWAYPAPAYQATRDAFRWRYRLVPYLYTMARLAHDTGRSLCRPVYYEHPEDEAAYAARGEYLFGDQALAAPIVRPANPDTGLAAVDVWLPPGTWIDHATKESWSGPRWVRIVGGLERVPLLMKAGAILPLAAPPAGGETGRLASGTTDTIPGDALTLAVFPGKEGHFRLYEDDGLGEGYRDGEVEWTAIEARIDGGRTWTVEVGPVAGDCPGLLDHRRYELRLEGSRRPERVTLNGAAAADWTYDPQTLTTIVRTPPLPKDERLTLSASARRGIVALDEAHNEALILADVRHLLGDRCPPGEDLDALLAAVLAVDGPGRDDAIARLGGPLVHVDEFTAPEDAARRLGQVVIGAPSRGAPSYDVEVTWTLRAEGQARQQTVRLRDVAGSQILDAPFAFDGQPRTARWTAEVRLAWMGHVLRTVYRSSLLFPSIYAWQVTVYDPEALEVAAGQAVPAGETSEAVLLREAVVHRGDRLAELVAAHGIFFERELSAELLSGRPLAATLSTTVHSPAVQPAVLRYHAARPAQLYVNGRQVPDQEGALDQSLPGHLRRGRVSRPFRLEAGANSLVIHTRPQRNGRPRWYLAAALLDGSGQPLDNLWYTIEQRR